MRNFRIFFFGGFVVELKEGKKSNFSDTNRYLQNECIKYIIIIIPYELGRLHQTPRACIIRECETEEP